MRVKATKFIAHPAGGEPLAAGQIVEVDETDKWTKSLINSGDLLKVTKREADEAQAAEDAPAQRGAP
jgi:hypothetical protein